LYYLFAADLHLKVSDSEEPYLGFKAFLDSIRGRCSRLYILGDLFTYWYEHPKVDFYSKNPALRELKRLKESGTKLYFLAGNRDFAAGRFFREYSGIDFMGNAASLEIPGQRVFLTHGDLFAKKDIRYQLWRMLIRSGLSSFIFKRLPVGYAIRLADRFKKVGRSKPLLEKIVASMIIDGARKFLENSKTYDTVICGHAHIETYYEFETSEGTKRIYIVSEFSFPGRFLVFDKGVFKYRQFG